MNFECARCRVWTGARETPLERVVGADAADIDEVRRRLFLRVVPSSDSGGGVFLARADARTKSRRVFLSSERFRSLAVYRLRLIYMRGGTVDDTVASGS